MAVLKHKLSQKCYENCIREKKQKKIASTLVMESVIPENWIIKLNLVWHCVATGYELNDLIIRWKWTQFSVWLRVLGSQIKFNMYTLRPLCRARCLLLLPPIKLKKITICCLHGKEGSDTIISTTGKGFR